MVVFSTTYATKNSAFFRRKLLRLVESGISAETAFPGATISEEFNMRADEVVLTVAVDGREVIRKTCAWDDDGVRHGTDPELIASVSSIVLGREQAERSRGGQVDAAEESRLMYRGILESLGY